jgi:hypothetical protein
MKNIARAPKTWALNQASSKIYKKKAICAKVFLNFVVLVANTMGL